MQKHFVVAICKTMREICATWFADKAEFCQSRTLFKGLPWGHQLFSKVLLKDRRYTYTQYKERPRIKPVNSLRLNNSTNTRNLWVCRWDTDDRETFTIIYVILSRRENFRRGVWDNSCLILYQYTTTKDADVQYLPFYPLFPVTFSS